MESEQVLVDITAIDKIFSRGSGEIHVLGGLDLTIPEGEFLALTGPSGSGKSTLLNIIGGLNRPSEGSVDMGVSVAGADRLITRHRVSLVEEGR